MHFTEPNIEVTEEDLKTLKKQLEFNSLSVKIEGFGDAFALIEKQYSEEKTLEDFFPSKKEVKEKLNFLAGYEAALIQVERQNKYKVGQKVLFKRIMFTNQDGIEEGIIVEVDPEKIAIKRLKNNYIKNIYFNMKHANSYDDQMANSFEEYIEKHLEFLKE